MSSRLTTTLVITLALLTAASSLAEADHAKVIGKFVGTWTENQAKRKLGSSMPGLRFRATANGSLEELRGPEARPLVQPIKFGSPAYGIDNSKNTIAWKQVDQRHFERQLFADGKVLTTRKIEISPDGKTLTEVTTRKSPDGKELTATVVCKKNSGGSKGLEGTWKPESMRTNEPFQQKIEAVGNALKVTGRIGDGVLWDLSGKPQPVTGPAVMSGMTNSAKLQNDNTIEITSSREGVVTGKTSFVLSQDGKTLTATSINVGNPGDPSVAVYEKH